MAKGSMSLTVEVEGRSQVVAAFKELGNPEAKFLRAALEKSAREVMAHVPVFLPSTGVSKPTRGRTHTPRASFTAGMAPSAVTGAGANLRITVVAKHRGIRSYEFGRSKSYYRGGSRSYKSIREMARNELTGKRRRQFRAGVGSALGVKGQPARPFMGILGGGAAGAASPQINPIIEGAFAQEARSLGLDYRR